MPEADYQEKIPNNVDLHEDRRLQRALESWQPNFLAWWSRWARRSTEDVYLRTAVNEEGRAGRNSGTWPCATTAGASSCAERDENRRIGFGQHMGGPVAAGARRVPGRAAAADRDQGDTEPAMWSSSEAGRHRAQPVRPAQPVPGQRGGGPSPVGDGLPAARHSGARAARRPKSCCTATPAAPRRRGSWARSTRRPRTGSASSCSPTSPTATASTSSAR